MPGAVSPTRNIASRRKHSAVLDAAGEAVAAHEIISGFESFDEALERFEIIAVVGAPMITYLPLAAFQAECGVTYALERGGAENHDELARSHVALSQEPQDHGFYNG
jgi:hypothetical protein